MSHFVPLSYDPKYCLKNNSQCLDIRGDSNCNLVTGLCTNVPSEDQPSVGGLIHPEYTQTDLLLKNVQQTYQSTHFCNKDSDCTFRGRHVCDPYHKLCVRGYPEPPVGSLVGPTSNVQPPNVDYKQEQRFFFLVFGAFFAFSMVLWVMSSKTKGFKKK